MENNQTLVAPSEQEDGFVIFDRFFHGVDSAELKAVVWEHNSISSAANYFVSDGTEILGIFRRMSAAKNFMKLMAARPIMRDHPKVWFAIGKGWTRLNEYDGRLYLNINDFREGNPRFTGGLYAATPKTCRKFRKPCKQ